MTKTAVAAPERANTIGLVLAGGRATRMGGVNKGLVLFNGEPMAGRVIRTLAGQVSRVWVSANRDADAFVKLGRRRSLPTCSRDSRSARCARLAQRAPQDRGDGGRRVDSHGGGGGGAARGGGAPPGVFVGAFDGSPAYTIETGGYDQNTISLVHVSVLPTVRPVP